MCCLGGHLSDWWCYLGCPHHRVGVAASNGEWTGNTWRGGPGRGRTGRGIAGAERLTQVAGADWSRDAVQHCRLGKEAAVADGWGHAAHGLWVVVDGSGRHGSGPLRAKG
jgi:hypothetical protein